MTPRIAGNLIGGSTTISGVLTTATASEERLELRVYRNGEEVIPSRVLTSSDGHFEIVLQRPLQAGERIAVAQVIGGSISPRSDEVTVQSSGSEKPPAPRLTGTVKAGDTEIDGVAEPYSGRQSALRLFINGTSTRAAEVLQSSTDGRFVIDVKDPFKAGDSITVTQIVNGIESEPSNELKIPAEGTLKFSVLSVDAIYGTSSVTVNFDAGSPAPEEVNMRLAGPVASTIRKLTADEIKAGKVELKLTEPLLDAAADGEGAGNQTVNGEFTATKKGFTDLSKPFMEQIRYADLNVTEPVKEGEKEIHGVAGPTVKHARAFVLGGWYNAPASYSSSGPAISMRRGEQQPAALRPNANEAVGERQKQSRFSAMGQRNEVVRVTENRLDAFVGQISRYTNLQSQPEILAQYALARDQAADRFREVLETSDADVHGKAFTIKLTRAPVAGEHVLICEMFMDTPRGDLLSDHCTETTIQSVTLDWGRVRGVFAFGGIIGQADNFTKVSPYVGFAADVNFFSNLVAKPSRTANVTDLFRSNKFGTSFHGFVVTRLTQATTTSAAANNTSSSTQPTMTSAAQVTARADTGTSSMSTNTTSSSTGTQRQPADAAYFSGGLYYAMRFRGMDWVYRGTPYSTYFAPLFKAGATHVKDGVVLMSTDQTTISTGATKNVAMTKDTGAIPFYGYGLRLGLMKYDVMGKNFTNAQLAPDPQAYVDVTWGQDGLYREARQVQVSQSGDMNVTQTIYDKRLVHGVEARVKLPYMPAQVGVDIIRFSSHPQRASSEFRFIVSFRVDANKALGRIFNMTGAE